MTKKMIITESQRKKLREYVSDDENLHMIGEKLKSFECTGEGIQVLVARRLNELGYEKIKMTFMGYNEDNNNLVYSIITEGPVFVIEAHGRDTKKPCLSIVKVDVYKKIS